MITEIEIRKRILTTNNSSVFSKEEIAFMCKKKKSEWQDLELAEKVKKIIYGK